MSAWETRLYGLALHLYPVDYRARFSREMAVTFRMALDEGRHPRSLLLTELSGVVLGAVREWLSKLTSDRAARGRSLPDCRQMRPAGVTPQEWAAGLEWIELNDEYASRKGTAN